MKSDASRPPSVEGAFNAASALRRIDRRVRVVRTIVATLRWTTLPALGALGVVFFRRALAVDSLLDPRAIGSVGLLALAYWGVHSVRRRLLREIDDLEDDRAVTLHDDSDGSAL